MGIEIEAKLKVDSHKAVESKLTDLGAEFLEEQSQKDYYFDNVNKTFTKTDRCLRLRKQLVGRKEKVFLTYKGAREKGKFKKRQEIETEIANADSMENMLVALGFEKALLLEKKRRLWQLGDCKVALDELPLLGSFVEIEGPDEEKIYNVQSNLDLADLPHIPESYTSLMADRLCRQQE